MSPKPLPGEGHPGLASSTRGLRILERASDPPPPERALRPLVFLVFSLQPEGCRLIEGGVFGLPISDFNTRFESVDAADEFDLRGARRVVRVELEMAGEGHDREQQIARFLRDLGGLS
jgi:hypothetical protein